MWGTRQLFFGAKKRLLPLACGLTTVQILNTAHNQSDGFKLIGEPDSHVVSQPSFGIASTSNGRSLRSNRDDITLDTLIVIGNERGWDSFHSITSNELGGTAHKTLAEEISTLLKVPLMNASLSRFSDGETSVKLEKNIRGCDVFIIQSCAAPVNDSIMELLLTVSCARRAGAKKITAVIPYFGYKHHRRGSSISSKHNSRFLSSGAMDFAKMLQEMGVDRVISIG